MNLITKLYADFEAAKKNVEAESRRCRRTADDSRRSSKAIVASAHRVHDARIAALKLANRIVANGGDVSSLDLLLINSA